MSDVNAMRARISAIEAEEHELCSRSVKLAGERYRLILDVAAAENRPHGRNERFAVAFLAGDHAEMRRINDEARGER